MRSGALALIGLLALAAASAAQEPETTRTSAPADALRDSLEGEGLRQLVAEVLERNPDVARLRHRAAAAAVRAPQVRALPDPEASLAIFVLPPETRVGPQRLSVAISQQLPWFGKLDLAEQAAVLASTAAGFEVEAHRLRLVTETRRLFYELSFLEQHGRLVSEEREHLLRHEEVARARYSAGMGLQQEALKIQANITRAETRLLEIEVRRRSLLASLNALRDRPAELEVTAGEPPVLRPERPDPGELTQRASRLRPELATARSEIARQEVMVDLAGKQRFPDLKVGLGYTVVGRREDAPGRLAPPPDNGDDIVALSVGARLPVWKRKIEAGIEEALESRGAAEEHLRQLLAGIAARIGDGAARLPLLHEQWSLFENVLLAQAEEALRSSEAAYTTGKLNALDLLDAEHVLFEVRTAAARTLTDFAVARAELEGAVGAPLGGPDGSAGKESEEMTDEQ